MRLNRWILSALLIVSASGLSKAEEQQNKTKQSPVYARFVPERKDDFAWENDMVAFRVYGPALKNDHVDSGIDCWLKRVSYPILDAWYKSGDYHEDHGEGCDPYHVGESRGCGGIALVKSDGGFQTAGTFTAWRILESTPTYAVFQLDYRYGDSGIAETKTIRIDAGKRLFDVESCFTENGTPRVFDVAVGISTHNGKAKTYFDTKEGWMACWEKLGRDGGLGTGVVLPGAEFREIPVNEKDQSHIWAFTKTDAQGKVAWRAGYGWSKSTPPQTLETWETCLRNAAKEPMQPLPAKGTANK